MIIYMSEILVFTNRTLCQEEFLTRIEKLAKAHPKGIVLREKDLSEGAYKVLAQDVLEICSEYGVPCILHNFVNAARELQAECLHLPLSVLNTLSKEEREKFSVLGASCHSVEDAIQAEQLGCTYLTAGHIFDTDCKKNLPGRGLGFLEQVCQSVSIPVYAIGGIDSKNIALIRNAGAAGACVMSKAMNCKNVMEYITAFKEKKNEI